MFARPGSAILRAPDPDPAGGGGSDSPQAFNEDQLKILGGLVSQTVNAALTDRFKRDLPKAVSEGLAGLKITDLISTEVSKLKPASVVDDDEGKGKPKAKIDPAIEQQIKDLSAKLEQSEKARQGAEQARIDAENKRLLEGATSEFRNGLQSKIRPDLLDVAVSHFGRGLKLGEDGTPLLRVKKAAFTGGPLQDEDVPISEGIPLLLASEGMKPFIPPPSGGEPAKRGGAPSGGIQRSGGSTPTSPAEKTLADLERLGISAEDL